VKLMQQKSALHMVLSEKLFEVPRYARDVLVQALKAVTRRTWPLVFIWTASPSLKAAPLWLVAYSLR